MTGPRSRQAARGARGQIIPILAISLVAIMAMLALLFDGAGALVARRQLQNAGDAGALAAVNILQSISPAGCSASPGPPPGAPQAAIVAAAVAGVQANLPGFPAGNVSVTCPNGWSNAAVRVTLTRSNGTAFGRVIGINDIAISTSSSAVNGLSIGRGYSVITLDPHNSSWAANRQGCPSVLFSGAPNVLFDGNLIVNSACPTGSGGTINMNGTAAVISFSAGAGTYSVGGVAASGLTFTPAPVTGISPVPDPFWNADYRIPAINTGALTTRQASRLILNNTAAVLEPGIYNGGIELRNRSIAYLRPGIYVLAGGGIEVGAQAKVFTIPASATSTSEATWTTDCPTASCGVLMFNTSGSTTAMGPMRFGAGAVTMLRAYEPAVDPTSARNIAYKDLLLWQDRLPVPTSTAVQPQLYLNGGGTVNVSGTVYAPSAVVEMGGGSGGSGGYAVETALQFIAWDLIFRGTANWHFIYSDSGFATPTDYGLIE